MKSPPGPPMRLGSRSARLCVCVIMCCKACGHQVEPDAAEMAERYGADTTVPEWRERLVCSRCGSRDSQYGNDRDREAITAIPPFAPAPR
jgi:hypothetical protein